VSKKCLRCPRTWDPILSGCGDGFDELRSARVKPISIPIQLVTDRHTPGTGDVPARDKGAARVELAGVAGRCCVLLGANLMLEGNHDVVGGLPFGDAVRKRAPKLQRRIDLVGPVIDRLLEGPLRRRFKSDLGAVARQAIRILKVKIFTDDEECAGAIVSDGISKRRKSQSR
jgi:hypothetical protein